MSDPKRLIEEGATDFERLLVASAASERPSAELGARMEVGVVSSKTAIGSATWILPWMWVGALAVVGGLVALLAFLPRNERSALPAEALQIMEAQHPPARGVPGASQDDDRAVQPAPLATAAAPAPPEAVASPKPSRASMFASPQPRADARPSTLRSPAPRALTATPVEEGDLHEEMLLIQGARAALRERDTALALRELRQHAARFPHGAFVPEAVALRVEALEQDGQHAKAVLLGRQFLGTYPDSPLADRVERITADKTR